MSTEKTVNMPNKEEMEVLEARKRLFNAVIDNLKAIGKSGNIGQLTIPLELLDTSAAFHEFRNYDNVDALARKWDERKVGAITVIIDYDRYMFIVVDGCHRVMAAMMVPGVDSLDAIVLLKCPTDPVEREKYAADFFIHRNDDDRRLTPIEKYPGLLIVGDPTALALRDVTEKYNVRIKKGKGNREAGIIGSYTDIMVTARTFGENGLEFTFATIEKAGWHMETNGYATHLTRMFRQLYKSYGKHAPEISDYLGEQFRKWTPDQFSAEARVAYPIRDYRIACVLLAQDMICEKFHLEKKLAWVDGRLRTAA